MIRPDMTGFIGITGKARAGKDSVGKHLRQKHNYYTIALAAPIKRALYQMFGITDEVWEDSKAKETEIPWLGATPRRLAQTLGTEWGRNMIDDNVWIKATENCIRLETERAIAITDVRFENEALWIINNGGLLIEVHRQSLEAPHHSHPSEAGIKAYTPHAIIENNGTLEQLWAAVDEVLKDRDILLRRYGTATYYFAS